MRFQCPVCRGLVSVDNSDMGINVQCGHCSEIVTVPSSRVAPGAVIGDFIIMQEIGRGGMGVVYLAHQMSLDRPAAVKVLADHYANNAEFVVGFIKEARAAAKLNHPNIVQAYAVGEDEGVFYFAMENIDGQTMKQVLKREHQIPVEQSLSIIQQIAEALDYAWKEQHLIHRDIKPDNIMLTANGRAKLADLGLARVAEDIDDSEDDEVMGTPQYISPEHLTGAPMDVRSDIYSLGATFYNFVTGRFPFEGRTATEIARKHLEEKLVPPNQVNKNIPQRVSRIIEKMMAKNPKQRYQDAEALVDDLRMARHGKEPLAATTTGSFSSGSLHKKSGLRISTKRRNSSSSTNTGGVTTTTGPLSNTSSGSVSTSSGVHTHSDIYNLKKVREAHARRRMTIMGIVLLLLILVIGGGIYYYTNVMKSSSPVPVKPPDKKKPDNVPDEKEPMSTPYTTKALQIIKFAKDNPESRNDIWRRCEDFFKNFPKPKYKVERDAMQNLLSIYIPIDEVRMNELRVEKRKQHIESVQTRKDRYEADQKAEEDALRKAEEQKAQQARREREKAEQKVRLEREIKEMQERILSDKQSYTRRVLTLSILGNYTDAVSSLEPLLQERDKAKGKDARIVAAAENLTSWAERISAILASAEKIHNAYVNGGDALKDSQLELRSELYKIVSVKDGTASLSSYNGSKRINVKLTQFNTRQQASLLRKAAGSCGEESNIAAYYLATGDFLKAKETVPDEMRDELSNIITYYLTEELKNASDTEKARLKKEYGRLEEFKKLEGEN